MAMPLVLMMIVVTVLVVVLEGIGSCNGNDEITSRRNSTSNTL